MFTKRCQIPEVSSERGSDGVELSLHFAQLLSHTDHNTSQRTRLLFWDLRNNLNNTFVCTLCREYIG